MAENITQTRKLNPKQRQFIEECVVDFNGTQAAIRAGYAPTAAGRHASRMLTNVHIKEAIS